MSHDNYGSQSGDGSINHLLRSKCALYVIRFLVVVTGVVLADQVKSLDWQVREAALIKKLPAQVVNEVTELLLTLLGQ